MEIYANYKQYIRGKSIMENEKGNENTHDKKGYIDKKGFITNVAGSVIGALIITIAGIFINGYITSNNVKIELEQVKQDTKRIDDNTKGIPERVANIEGQLGIIVPAINLKPTQSAISKININSVSFGEDYLVAAGPGWSIYDIIGMDETSGDEYTTEELVNKKIILPYKDNGQDVIFYGEINENMHWNGSCTINVYDNDILILVYDAYYGDGVLLSYKQIFQLSDKYDGDVWILSERRLDNGKNVGESTKYTRNSKYMKSFNLDNVQEDDIVNVDKFNSILCNSKKIGYYNGTTSDGLYNDNTGNAYLIKYADDGTIKTLYQGDFKNGFFEDNTGNAWYIVKDLDTEYMYYKGNFKAGSPANNKKREFINPITIDEIRDKIKGNVFNSELVWYEK